MKSFRLIAFLTLLLAFTSVGEAKQVGNFTVGKGTFLLNGKPFIVKAAEVHYPRIPRPYWEQRIKMCKALGMNTLCLYVFWNIHEPVAGQFNFSGNNRRTACTSLCAPDLTSALNGKWVDCPGGC